MRIPFNARNVLGLNVGDVISDGDIRNRFNNLYSEKALQVSGNTSKVNITEGVVIKNNMENGRTVDIFLNNIKISSTSGIIKNGTYSIYVNGNRLRTITFNDNGTSNTYYQQVGSDILKIEIGGPIISDMEFANSSTGKFLNFVY
jgi:hypothetical protein